MSRSFLRIIVLVGLSLSLTMPSHAAFKDLLKDATDKAKGIANQTVVDKAKEALSQSGDDPKETEIDYTQDQDLVLSVQHELVRLGHNVATDGQYGPGTKNAILAAETAAGVEVSTGSVSPALVQFLKTIETPAVPADPAIPAEPATPVTEVEPESVATPGKQAEEAVASTVTTNPVMAEKASWTVTTDMGKQALSRCQNNPQAPTYYDCSCVASKFETAHPGDAPDQSFMWFIKNEAEFQQCTDRSSIQEFGSMYCHELIGKYAHTDWEAEVDEVCGCTGDRTADEFMSTPSYLSSHPAGVAHSPVFESCRATHGFDVIASRRSKTPGSKPEYKFGAGR